MISRRQSLRRLADTGLGAAALWSAQAFSANFLSLEQAQKLLLPQADQFQNLNPALDAARLAHIAAATQAAMPKGFAPSCWLALQARQRLGWVLMDRVVGKFELIDYAAGFSSDGSMTGIEILAYRESHGSEIRSASWRQQFVGKKGPGQLHFHDDIRNISGATLSCQHVTEGAQRLSALVQLLREA